MAVGGPSWFQSSRFSWPKPVLRPWVAPSLVALIATFSVPNQASAQTTAPELRIAKNALLAANSERVSSSVPNWPHKGHIGPFRFYSTVPLSSLESDLPRLQSLPGEIASVLGVRINETPIHVVVLEDKESFEHYLKEHYPQVPNRRALFIRDRGAGLVLTAYHPNWLMDARHECTHAIMHAQNVSLPLWLDEGLAEYFETTDANRVLHPVHHEAVKTQLRFGQVPELEPLELKPSHSEMNGLEYRDAWALVAFMVHHSDVSRETFRTYVDDLLRQRSVGLLHGRVRESVPQFREEFTTFFRQN